MTALANTNSGGIQLSIQARVAEVISTLGYLPDGVLGALRVIMLDILAHHRAKVGEHVAQDFPAGRRAQKFWFSRSFLYMTKAETSIAELRGESFAVGLNHGQALVFGNLQAGGDIHASSPFVIPFGRPGMDFRGRRKQLSSRSVPGFGIRQTEHGAMLISDLTGITQKGTARRGGAGGRGARVDIIGFLRTHRRQRALLKFFLSMDEILPKHQAQLDRVLDLAVDAASKFSAANRLAELVESAGASVAQGLARPMTQGGKLVRVETNQSKAVREFAAQTAEAIRMAPVIGRGGGGGGSLDAPAQAGGGGQ